MSAGYFQSVNCMRELLSALVTGKRLVTLVELEDDHGGLSREQVLKDLREADKRYFSKWGDLREEVVKWLRELPEHTTGIAWLHEPSTRGASADPLYERGQATAPRPSASVCMKGASCARRSPRASPSPRSCTLGSSALSRSSGTGCRR